MIKIKLIWDFRGPNAYKIAEHHVVHLKQYITIQKTELDIIGYEQINTLHAIAYMVVYKHEMKQIRDVLKPHRGQIYTD